MASAPSPPPPPPPAAPLSCSASTILQAPIVTARACAPGRANMQSPRAAARSPPPPPGTSSASTARPMEADTALHSSLALSPKKSSLSGGLSTAAAAPPRDSAAGACSKLPSPKMSLRSPGQLWKDESSRAKEDEAAAADEEDAAAAWGSRSAGCRPALAGDCPPSGRLFQDPRKLTLRKCAAEGAPGTALCSPAAPGLRCQMHPAYSFNKWNTLAQHPADGISRAITAQLIPRPPTGSLDKSTCGEVGPSLQVALQRSPKGISGGIPGDLQVETFSTSQHRPELSNTGITQASLAAPLEAKQMVLPQRTS
ncbi:WAS/WASL-interacting protein family member 3-like [Varanus komodoensis]|uniref:WAS/WASL-interacting protein family member 3-like n=1 Tax=Varanus komodoensis TaxID=61221 RepID=UPI001CF7C56C|nr:WAS/WASL-interacting protein family member 3-like [Varanus komodoensis]